MMSAQDYRDVRLGWGDRGVDLGGNYDWLDGVTRTGFSMHHTLTVSGGNERSNYRVSADYRDANGIDLRSNREEYGARASVSHTTKGGLFTVQLNVAPRIIYRDNADWGVFKDALEANPTTPLMNPENQAQYYNFNGQVVGSNPVERQVLETNHSDTKLLDWDGTLKLNLLPLFAKNGDSAHNLSTQIMFADHQYSNNDSWFRPSTSTECINNGHESMSGNKIGAVNDAIVNVLPMLEDISSSNPDAEIKVAALEFSNGTKWLYNEPKSVEDFKWIDVQAGGLTSLGEACLELNSKLSRSGYMKSASGSYAPAIILLSDGGPTDNFDGGLQTIQGNNWFKNAIRIAIAIGDDADLDVLARFTGNSEAVIKVQNIDALKQIIRIVAVTSSQIGSKSSSAGDTSKQDQVIKDVNQAVDNIDGASTAAAPDSSSYDDWD